MNRTNRFPVTVEVQVTGLDLTINFQATKTEEGKYHLPKTEIAEFFQIKML